MDNCTQEERRCAYEQALASARIEGHVPEPAFMADVGAAIAGTMTPERLLAASLARAQVREQASDQATAADRAASSGVVDTGRGFSDPYVYPGTHVLKNIPGLRDSAALDAFEYEAGVVRAAQLSTHPVMGKFDLAHLQAIHKQLFQDVYAWAGQTRTVNISKNDSHFAQVAFIESSAAKIASDLAKERHLRGLGKSDFVARLAYHFAEWNAVHPFREGNGRATREFLEQLARGAGYRLPARSNPD